MLLRPWQLPKRERLPERKCAMTIALGMVCSDGAIIAADRQMTKEGGLKFQEKKVFKCKMFGSIPMEYIFAYAGEPEAAKIIEYEIGRALVGGVCGGNIYMPDLVIRDLQPVFDRKEAKKVESLIAIGAPKIQPLLLRTKGPRIVHGYIECIGVGDSSVIRYFSDRLTGQMSIEQGKPFIAYLVSLANKYIDGCGFGPDIAFFGSSGIVEEVSEQEKSSYEGKFEKLERDLANQISAL
jgi:hypothetical protein